MRRTEAPDRVDQIEIASPCSVPWDSMRGDERVRFCGQCRQSVYNIQAMSRGEARRLIAGHQQRLCVRILRRDDGTVVTADCWSRLRAARRRGIVPFVGMLLVVGWAQLVAMRFGWQALQRLRQPPRVAVPGPAPVVVVPRPLLPPGYAAGSMLPEPRVEKGRMGEVSVPLAGRVHRKPRP